MIKVNADETSGYFRSHQNTGPTCRLKAKQKLSYRDQSQYSLSYTHLNTANDEQIYRCMA